MRDDLYVITHTNIATRTPPKHASLQPPSMETGTNLNHTTNPSAQNRRRKRKGKSHKEIPVREKSMRGGKIFTENNFFHSIQSRDFQLCRSVNEEKANFL